MLSERGFDVVGVAATMEGDWTPVHYVPSMNAFCWEQNDSEFTALENTFGSKPKVVDENAVTKFCQERGEFGRIYLEDKLILLSSPASYEVKDFLFTKVLASGDIDIEESHSESEL